MHFVLADHGYPEFLDWLYRESIPGLSGKRFVEQQQAYFDTLFATSDFYVNALHSLGHKAEQLIVNCDPMQGAWEREFAPPSLESAPFSAVTDTLRRVSRKFGISRFRKDAGARHFELMLKQVRTLAPDVLYIQSIHAYNNDQLKELKSCAGRLVGEHAAMPLPDEIDFRLYDLVVSSFEPTLDWLRARGVRCELNRLAFDARVDAKIPHADRDVTVSFSGSLFEVHTSRLKLLDAVAVAVPSLQVFGNVTIKVPASSKLDGRIRPALWGRDMYALLRRSVITLNHHGNVLPYANNMRLYEATGMGALLVTDYSDNLPNIFDPETEVVSYKDADECVDKIRFYLDDRNASARDNIMRAGHRRTLADHTYEARMRRLVELVRAL